MASQAQIDANKRNAAKSTGPKTEAGKARVKLNALKDGSHARTARPVLPQENAAELQRRIDQWIIDLDAHNDFHASSSPQPPPSPGRSTGPAGVRPLAWLAASARLNSRTPNSSRKRSASWHASFCTTPDQKSSPSPGRPRKTTRPPTSPGWKTAPRDAAGCWIAGRVCALLDHNLKWTNGDMFSLVRLVGKCPVEAITDPKLNAVLLAFDAMVPGWAERFWKECEERKPLRDPGFSDFGRWRVIAEKPADAAQGMKFFLRPDGRARGPAGGAAGAARGDCR